MSNAKETTVSTKEKAKTVTDPKVDAAVREKLITARIGLLIRAPFFGNMATRLVLENGDEWLPTAATDGRKFYYNSEFVNKLSVKETEFLFGHEVLHNVYDHMGRRGERDPRLFNVAADYCVNADLIDQRIGEKINKVPVLFDPRFKGMSAEEVYDKLYDEADKIDLESLMKQVLDDHMEGDGDGDGDEDGDGKGRPRLSEEEKKAIRDEIKEAMLAAAQAVGAGNLPAGVKRMITEMTEPKITWRELLQQQIESTVKSDFTWLRPSRRGWHCDAILPGMKPQETIDVAIAIDTSGSISQEMLREFLSEIKGIMDAYSDFKIMLWTFDTQVYNMQEFTADNSSDLLTYEPQGGGGTDFDVNWTFMREQDIQPKKFIMFTDGYPFGSWGDEDYCDTVWIINGNKDAEPPFGVWAIYETQEIKSR
jgi:predicted metal-dependent peptidase